MVGVPGGERGEVVDDGDNGEAGSGGGDVLEVGGGFAEGGEMITECGD